MSFEKLRVYQAAELLDREVRALVQKLPPGYARDIDQLLRALGSILYNIPEANASLSPGRRRYHNEVALGSSDEVRAILRRLASRGAFPMTAIQRHCARTSAIAKMLKAMTVKSPPR